MFENLPIREDRKPDYLKALKKAQNFFKHADRDADTILDFDSFMTESLLMDAYLMYQRLGRTLHEGHIFQAWIAVVHPDLIVEDSLWNKWAIEMRQAADRLALPVDDKQMFRKLLDLDSQEP